VPLRIDGSLLGYGKLPEIACGREGRGMKQDERKAATVIQMPALTNVGCGKFWFFLPVPFLYSRWPFKAGERLLVTVTRYKEPK
jgi:hypothetical protein